MEGIGQIKKRNGQHVPFDSRKITEAIYKAAVAEAGSSGKTADKNVAENLSSEVVGTLEHMFNGNVTIPTVEQLQNLVERTLIKRGYADTAKRYIIYREHHRQKREMDEATRGISDKIRRTISGFRGGGDWRTQENANENVQATNTRGNVVPTFQSLYKRLAGDDLQIYALNEMYGNENPEISKAHETGQMHIHDLDFPIIAYCCGHSLEQIIKKGYGGVKGRISAGAAKHLDTLALQMVNFIGTVQNEFAGAQAFSSVDTFLAPFVRYDGLSEKDVRQAMQELIYNLNAPSRWGGQTPFSNLTFDLTCPEDLRDKHVIIGGKEQKETYAEFQKEMDVINENYLRLKLEGDNSGTIHTFPIDTYNITKDFQWNGKEKRKWNPEVTELLFEVAGKYGIPYFQNYIGSGLDPRSIRAMCCRLNLDQTQLMNRPGGMWSMGDSTGSIGVVTINMNRIGYEAHNEEEFFNLLKHRMNLAKQSLEVKRGVINELLEDGFVPYTKEYIGHFINHFSTIGVCGMNEACMNFLGKDILTAEGHDFSVKTLNFMREKMVKYQEETGNLYNLEATPAEGTSYRFARLDRETYPNIYVSGNGTPFLTNSTQLPVDADIDLFTALKHQEDLQTLYTGGTIFHAFLGERISGESAKNLVRKIAENTKLPYFSLTPVFSICDSHGYIAGNHETCPTCSEPTDVYDRIVGYIRPIKAWNAGKQEEFRHRKRINPDLKYV